MERNIGTLNPDSAQRETTLRGEPEIQPRQKDLRSQNSTLRSEKKIPKISGEERGTKSPKPKGEYKSPWIRQQIAKCRRRGEVKNTTKERQENKEAKSKRRETMPTTEVSTKEAEETSNAKF